MGLVSNKEFPLHATASQPTKEQDVNQVSPVKATILANVI